MIIDQSAFFKIIVGDLLHSHLTTCVVYKYIFIVALTFSISHKQLFH